MALLQKSDVDAISEEMVMSNLVQKYLIQAAKLFDKVQNQIVPNGVDKAKFPKAGGFAVQDKVAGTAVTAQTLTYSTDDLNIDKHKVIQVNVEKFANTQSKVSLFEDIAKRVAAGMALQIDTDIINALYLTSSAAPDHRLAYAGASLAAADILEGLRLLKVQNVPTNECFLGISPASEKAILSIDNFIRADAYGASESALSSGVIGKLFGLPVIVHNGFADLKTMIWHPSHVAVGMQENPTYDTAKDLPNLSQLHSWDMMYGVITLDSGKRGVMLGTAT